ncbi:MAG TPA: condensation domain-containing protein, partial [Pyrinomonadaceae bacterium]
MDELAKLPGALTPEQRALFHQRLRRQRSPAPAGRAITRRAGASTYPLSFEQEQLWVYNRLEPDLPVHNLNHSLLLRGALDVAALSRSFEEVMRRHEILRSAFVDEGGHPLQVVAPAAPGILKVVDLGALPDAERRARVTRMAVEQAREPFDVTRRPLMRATLLRLADDEHALLLTLHHIITDWWSFKILYKELSALYEAFSEGLASPLAELPIQFGDFAVWQREHLQGELLESLLAYWRRQLAGAPAALALPADRPRPANQTFRGLRRQFTLPPGLTDSLKALSREAHVTLFTTLLAAFQTLLHRYAGQADILVGTPLASRQRGETEGLIGFFLNNLVLRADFSHDPTFSELLAQVSRTVVEAYRHQELPFRKLVEAIAPERDLSRTPIFQANFVFLNAQSPVAGSIDTHRPAVEFGGLTVSELNVQPATAEFDLTLVLEDFPDGLAGFFEYNTDLFEGETVARMVGHLHTLLGGIVSQPSRRVSALPLLTQAERQQLLVGWNDTSRPYARH